MWPVYIINLHVHYVDYCKHISYGQPSSPQCEVNITFCLAERVQWNQDCSFVGRIEADLS